MSPYSELDFKCLCKKLVLLFLILGARRKQVCTFKNVMLDHDKVILLSNKTLKHSAPNCHLKPLVYHSYKEKAKISIVD